MKREKGMITNDWDVTVFSHGGRGYCPDVMVGDRENMRQSAILGPDGLPLLVGYSPRPLGFDLTPRSRKPS